MERRRFKRFETHLKSVIIFEGKKYPGFVENVSEEGFAFAYLPSKNPEFDKFSKDKIIDLLFSLPTNEILNLNCRIFWTVKDEDAYKKLSMGLEIQNPPLKFREFVRTLK